MHEDEGRPGMESPSSRRRSMARLIACASSLLFVVVVTLPLIRRVLHPTILGDDVTRIADLIAFPFREHMFMPFAEHIAPLFQLVSRVTWELIGHDVRLAPIGFCAASVLSWALVLALLGFWLWRETGSRTAALIAVALAAESPLVLETAWWYSASSFLWAIAGVLIALVGTTYLLRRPISALSMIALGSALGLAGTTLGILAAPLAILRASLDPTISRRLKLLVLVVALSGVVSYRIVCIAGGVSVFHTDPRAALPRLDVVGGVGYALSVPGRLLWPSLVGVPVSWMIVPMSAWLCCAAGVLALAVHAGLAFWPRARWNKRLVVVGIAMIYFSYALTYSARTIMLKQGRWTEPELLYVFASRYHVLPLLGLVTIIAALLASWPRIRRYDLHHGRPALIAALVGVATMAVQSGEASQWEWMLLQPDQHGTLSALHRVGDFARAEGIPRPQLIRIFDPVYRSWNASLVNDCPRAFHLMNLTVQAPEHVERPISDEMARARVVNWLTLDERISLGAGTCAPLFSVPLEQARTLSIARRVIAQDFNELGPWRYKRDFVPGYIEFEFEPATGARYLFLPGLVSDQDVIVVLTSDSSRWRGGQNVRWLKSPRADATIDLGRLIHWSGDAPARIRLKCGGPGEIALGGAPRLLR
jgi:hypothetical protein